MPTSYCTKCLTYWMIYGLWTWLSLNNHFYSPNCGNTDCWSRSILLTFSENLVVNEGQVNKCFITLFLICNTKHWENNNLCLNCPTGSVRLQVGHCHSLGYIVDVQKLGTDQTTTDWCSLGYIADVQKLGTDQPTKQMFIGLYNLWQKLGTNQPATVYVKVIVISEKRT